MQHLKITMKMLNRVLHLPKLNFNNLLSIRVHYNRKKILAPIIIKATVYKYFDLQKRDCAPHAYRHNMIQKY